MQSDISNNFLICYGAAQTNNVFNYPTTYQYNRPIINATAAGGTNVLYFNTSNITQSWAKFGSSSSEAVWFVWVSVGF